MQARKKHSEGSGIDSITISTSQQEEKKKKMKKKKTPAHLHIHQQEDDDKKQEDQGMDKGWTPGALVERDSGSWVIEEKELQGPQKTRIKRADQPDDESRDNGDARGKKKKRKKAILKLLLLGAILKAKIGLLLQLFSAHLQVKFFAIALAGLALNIARFWLDLKKGHTPQKVIYYEHAQHQHHYDHEDDSGWGGYWSRSIDANSSADKKVQDYSDVASSGSDLAYGGWTGRNSRTLH